MKDDAAPKFKITSSFFQIVLLLGAVYQIPWPQDYLLVLSFFSVFEFDILRIFKVGCLVQVGAHTILYSLSILLLMLEGAVVGGLLFLILQRQRSAADLAQPAAERQNEKHGQHRV